MRASVMTLANGAGSVRIHAYDTAAAMFRANLDAAENPNVRMWATPGNAFYGRLTWGNMRDALTGAYRLPDAYSQIVAALPPLGDDTDHRTIRAVAGSRPNVPAHIAGSVRSMWHTRAVDVPDAPIRICCEFGGWANYSAELISALNTGAVAAALSLRQAGGAVEFYVAKITGHAEEKKTALMVTCPVELDAADPYTLAAVAHSGMMRMNICAEINSERATTEQYTPTTGRACPLAFTRQAITQWANGTAVVFVSALWQSPEYCDPALLAAAHAGPIAVRDYVLAQVDALTVPAVPTY